MLCLVHYLFVISTSAIDCLGRFVSEMTHYVSSGTLHPANYYSCSGYHNKHYCLRWDSVPRPCAL